MRQITIDFASQLHSFFAGYIGEHNATEITVIRPADLTGVMYSIAFMTNGEVIHSKYFSADEEIKIALWQQLTLDNDLYVQLEAFDENGDYLGKSTTAKLVLSNSVHGTDVIADADNPDVYSEIALNTWFRETLEDNVDTLDKLTTSKEGRLLFDGKPLGGGSGGGSDGGLTEEQLADLAANTKARHTHNNQWNVLDLLQLDRDQLHLLFAGYGTVAYTSDVPDPIPANDINNYFGAGNPIRSGFIGRLAAMELIDQVNARFATKELVEGLGSPLRVELVGTLPETGEEGVIYLVPSEQAEFNVYKEYLFVNGSFELIGSTQIDLTGYAKTGDIAPAVNSALAEAKASGEFDGVDGKDGISGQDGADGLSAYQIWLNAGNTGTEADFLASLKGADGERGADGVSVTHEWEGTVLKVTSASGKSSVDLKGEKGDSGVDGTSVTVASVSESTEDGGSNVVTFSDGKTLTINNGSKGDTGAAGKDGYTPIKGVDYFDGKDGVDGKDGSDYVLTEADKAEINAENIAFISTELAKRGQLKPEFAENLEWLKENGDTSKMYVMPDGFIYAYMPGTGTAQGSEKLTVTWYENNRLSTSDGGLRSGASGYAASERIDLSVLKNIGDILTVEGLSFKGTDYQSRSIAGFADNAFISAYYPSTTATFPIGNSGVTIKNLNSSQNVATLEKVADSDGKTYEVAFCGYGSGSNAVVTYTGEVEMDGVMMWCNTGHAFVPADYEDRIISLEKDNKILKTDNESLKTRVKALEDATIYEEGVPSYVLTEAEEVADKILSVRNADSFVMGLASDLHTNGTDTSSVGVLHAGQAMDIINSMTQIDLVSLLGDYEIYGFSYGDGDTDGEDARVSFKHAKKCFNSVAKGVPLIMLQGNHDELPSDTTEEARQKYYAYIGANNVGTVTDYDNKFRNYGYRDFENYKIRVIYLNTTDVSDNSVAENCYVSTEQLNWLNTVALKLPNEDWLPIVLSHHPLNWSGMSSILDALNIYKGTDKSVIHFHGHLHNFRAETLGTNSVPTITIPNACFGRNNEYGTSSSYDETTRANFGDVDENGNQRQFNKTANTAEDTAFNIVVVDREKRKIHCFNYGAGIDREISY